VQGEGKSINVDTSGSEGLAVLPLPQRLHKFHIRLAFLPMSGSDPALDVLSQLWIESSRLDVFKFNLSSKVDTTKRMKTLSHHGAEGR